MKFVEGEPGILGQFIMWLVEKIDDWYYRHWGYKRWTFGDKWNAMIRRENLRALLLEIDENLAKGLRGDGTK